MVIIKRLTAEEAQDALAHLIEVLRDTVDRGASIGFLPPLLAGEAWEYWEKVIADVAAGSRMLLVAEVDGEIAGAVQLALEMRANGAHRGEVQKLMVHRRFRRQGIARLLMQAVEATAQDAGRSLLVLDTRQGDAAEGLYRKLGYCEVGVIPGYALNGMGGADGTVVFYKRLNS